MCHNEIFYHRVILSIAKNLKTYALCIQILHYVQDDTVKNQKNKINTMRKIPDLSFWKLWNISFGFFGVQIAYALQSANISRIFSTLGADPHDLSYFWILPPLAGIIVQPIIGALSDRT